ncbi:MAG: methyltransferase domain-containing protein [Candidatus Lambdaproteobacteria bacterium]|nr:methyltransferase domain-containing protein [Candidatus Lambdaproteobacteria bacterium]
MTDYVDSYSAREAQRLHDQAHTLSALLHDDTRYAPGSRVLEVACGVGAQTAILLRNSPGVRLTSIDIAHGSLVQARAQARAQGAGEPRFCRCDLYAPPYADAAFDHLFLCFVLEHLADPPRALRGLLRVLKPGGTCTVIEGDHGSCYFHPHTAAAQRAWDCLIRVQAALGGDSLIGRRLYPLLRAAGLRELAVSPRNVYCDAGRPAWMDGFVMKTIIPMVEGVREAALAGGLIDADTWAQGIADLHATGRAPQGTFCYTFFKGVGRK